RTGGSPLEGSRSISRIATLSGPTWTLRLPRIGPAVTPISRCDAMSAMNTLQYTEGELAAAPSLRRCQPDQVRRVRASAQSQPLRRGPPGNGRTLGVKQRGRKGAVSRRLAAAGKRARRRGVPL